MRKLELDSFRRMVAEREREETRREREAGIESPLVSVSLIDLILWGAEIFGIGATASLLLALLLK